LALLAAILLLGACTDRPAAFPAGIFTREYINSLGAGDLLLELENGRFHSSSSSLGELAEGVYQVDGDQVIFTEEQRSEIEMVLCGDSTRYVYRWEFDSTSEKLTFFPTDDPCLWRGLGHTGGPWEPFIAPLETV
jgi:hypothetical protein